MENWVGRWHHLIPRFNEVGESEMHANAIKCFESEHRIVSHNPNSPTWTYRESQSWVTDLNLALGSLVAHRGPCQLELRSSSMMWLFKGNWEDYESRLSHSPLNPSISKVCSCPSIANLPRLTQFHYWRARNETNIFLHGKIPCSLLWRIKWPLKASNLKPPKKPWPKDT